MVIITDSQSAVQKINRLGIIPDTGRCTLNIKSNQINITKRGVDVQLAWIPSHREITRDMKVDELANVEADLQLVRYGKHRIKNHIPMWNDDMWKLQEEEWLNIREFTSKRYPEINSTINKKPWFQNHKPTKIQTCPYTRTAMTFQSQME